MWIFFILSLCQLPSYVMRCSFQILCLFCNNFALFEISASLCSSFLGCLQLLGDSRNKVVLLFIYCLHLHLYSLIRMTSIVNSWKYWAFSAPHRVPTSPWNPWKFVNLKKKEFQGPGKFLKINIHRYRSLKVLEFLLCKTFSGKIPDY